MKDTEDPDLEAMSLTELNRLYGEMVLTAIDLDLKSYRAQTFADVTSARAACGTIHGGILARRAGLAAMDNQTDKGPTPREVDAKEGNKMSMFGAATPAAKAKPKSKFTGKKKASAAKGKKAKKTTSKRSSYGDDMKIVVTVKDNPRREGSAKHKQLELAKKHSTVGAFLKAGGKGSTLKSIVKRKWGTVG